MPMEIVLPDKDDSLKDGNKDHEQSMIPQAKPIMPTNGTNMLSFQFLFLIVQRYLQIAYKTPKIHTTTKKKKDINPKTAKDVDNVRTFFSLITFSIPNNMKGIIAVDDTTDGKPTIKLR